MRMYRFSLLLLCLLCSTFIFSQKLNIEQLQGLKIRNIGPAGMSGRVTAIDVDLTNPDRIYVGTASGGVWLSENGGINWTPIFDDEATQSIGAVAINQANPAEIWVGTGEGNPRNSQNSGSGIYKSLDGGKTWQLMGLEATKTIHRIIIHRDNPDVVYVGAQGSAWGANKERGIYRTKDGGKTWKQILYKGNEVGCADLVVDPNNPNKMIAALWEFGRKPWIFNSGGKGSGMYITYDGGDTWKRKTHKDGLPKGNLGRIGLAIAPSSPNIVYALVEAKENALYKSTDGGDNWKKIADDKTAIGNRPFYYSDIFVDPANENRIYSLYSLVSRSEDGGKNFEVILPYYSGGVHPDHHALWIHPEDPSFIINGNDGGLYISRDKGENWQFAANLPLAQFYHINHDMSVPYKVAGGMQDNGSWIGPSQVWKRGGIRNYDWQEVFFGDGFDVLFHPKDSRYVYAMYQGGNVAYIDTKTGKSQSIKPIHPEGETLRFHWNAAIAQNPFEDCGIYFGSQFVHKSLDCGQSWEIISPDLTTNDTLKQKQYMSGGLTTDDTEAENHTTILAIAPSSVDEGVIWVSTDDGNLQVTKDGGTTWTNVADKLSGMKAGSWIPFIELSKKNAGEAFVIVNDYRRNDWRPMAYHTTDYGASFTRIVNEKQVEGHALSIVQDPEAENLLWLGTDYGLYMSIDKGKNWNKWMNDFPSVSTRDLKIHPREHDLIVGTFGRAAWILDDLRPIRTIAQTNGKVLEKDFSAFPSPDAYLAEYRAYDGIRFTGDGEYIGENRKRGAMLTLWVKPTKEETAAKAKEKKGGKEAAAKSAESTETPKKKDEKVKIQVLNSEGDTIRTYRMKLDTGMNRIYWNLRKDGVRFPSRKEVKPDEDLPSGTVVLPGDYKVLFTYQEHQDSTMVKVHADPRQDFSKEDAMAKAATYEQFYDLIKAANEGFEQLKTVRKTIDLVDKALVNAPDSTKMEIQKLGKSLKDSLDVLEKLYLPEEGLKKGYRRPKDNLQTAFYQVYNYLRSSEDGSGQSLDLLLQTARKKTQTTLDAINAFMRKDVDAYQEQVELVQYSLFQDLEMLKLD